MTTFCAIGIIVLVLVLGAFTYALFRITSMADDQLDRMRVQRK